MGVFTFENEHTSPVAAATLYKAFVFDAPTVFPKVNEKIQSIEILEGNGDAGTIKKLTFVEVMEAASATGDGNIHYLKHKVDALDKDNFVYNYTMVESDKFPDYFEKISYETKLVEAPNGAIVKVIVKIFTKGDAQLKEEDGKKGKEKSEGLFKAIEAYLLANPNY